MKEQFLRQTERDTRPTDVLIEAACHVAGTEEIGAVYVVTNRRPTYAELAHYRREADARALALNVDASSIAFRPSPITSHLSPPHPVIRLPSSVFSALSAQGRLLRAEFAAMSEGTR